MNAMIQYMSEENIQQYECGTVDVAENAANDFTIYPNPANEFLRIGGNNLDNVLIFNAVGQKVDGFEANDIKEFNINTSNYQDGVYFVKIGEKTERFVVTH